MISRRRGVIDRALRAKQESSPIEFKAELDLTQKRQACEFLKDLFAIANSGGGVIVVGLRSDGAPSGISATSFLKTDPATLTDLVNAYAGEQYSDFDIREHRKGGQRIASIELGAVPVPLVPMRPGTFEEAPKKQRAAFSAGVVYVRHGAKSEPATTRDLEALIERRLRQIRKAWLGGMRKVVAAPADSEISVTSRSVRLGDGPHAAEMRLTDSPDAPEFQLVYPDKTYPYRMGAFLIKLNRALSTVDRKATEYDIRAIRHVFRLDQDLRYMYKSRYGVRQYSEGFASWVIAKVRADRLFLIKTRSKFRSEKRRGSAGA